MNNLIPIVSALVGLTGSLATGAQRSDEASAEYSFAFEGRQYSVQLEPMRSRAADFSLILESSPGHFEEIESPTPCKLHRGTVPTWPGATVFVSLRDEISGIVVDRDTGRWLELRGHEVVAPAADADPAAHHHHCGCDSHRTGAGAALPSAGAPSVPTQTTLAAGALQQRTLVLDVDSQLYSVFAGDVELILDTLELMAAPTRGVFENDTDVQILLRAVLIRTTLGPYGTESDPATLTSLVANYWQGLSGSIVHLITGRNLNGSVIGWAYLGDVCGNLARGVDQFSAGSSLIVTSKLLAHELGHNFNQVHCDGLPGCDIMNSVISSSSTTVGSFSPAVANGIRSFSQSQGCASVPSVPLTLPATENTSIGAGLDTTFWDATNYATVSMGGMGAPSGVARIGRSDPNGYPLPGRLLSQPITTTPITSLKVSVSASYLDLGGGVPQADTLVVEYEEFGHFETIGEITLPSGASTVTEEFWTPPARTFAGTRIRLRQRSSDFARYWYIHDVTLEDGAFTAFCIATPNATFPFGGWIGASGSTSVTAGGLTLEAGEVNPGQLGMFIVSDDPFAFTPAGNGFVCLGGTAFRYPTQTADSSGRVSQLAINAPFSLNAGDSWHFQYWYRDAGPGAFNFTGGVSLTLTP